MANFIEELFYGNIEPQNTKKEKSKSYSREMKILSENEAVDDIMIKVINTKPKRKHLFWR